MSTTIRYLESSLVIVTMGIMLMTYVTDFVAINTSTKEVNSSHIKAIYTNISDYLTPNKPHPTNGTSE